MLTPLILGVLAASVPARRQLPDLGGAATVSVAPTHNDVPYVPGAGTPQLDRYLPAGTGLFPLSVNSHGGGFTFGDKRMLCNAIGPAFLNAGDAVARVAERLSGQASFHLHQRGGSHMR